MATTSNQYDGTPIDQDYEEPYDWKVGPCAGMTWLEWCEAQLEAMDVVIDPTDDDADKQEETELVCPPTPRASASRSVKRQLFKSPPKNQTQTQNLHHPTTLVEEISTIQKNTFTPPKKAKTRAEKRAEDTSDIEDDNNQQQSDFVTPTKKERRTDYWAQQDDLKVKRARAFKQNGQIFGEVA
jgi:hypothetical protein